VEEEEEGEGEEDEEEEEEEEVLTYLEKNKHQGNSKKRILKKTEVLQNCG
jgi:hypothetical protein